MKKILGIGNALVDVIIFLPDNSVLQKFSLPLGSMQLVNANVALEIEHATDNCRRYMASGGSAANTIHGLAGLRAPTGFIGTVGRDAYGNFFGEDLDKAGIIPLLTRSETPTGSSRALVSPGGERTMATFLGAATELSAGMLDASVFARFDHLHLEGYLVLNHELVEQALKLARQYSLSVSLDLASYNVVESNLEFLYRILQENVDVVFANEEEARSFTGKTDPREALDDLSALCDTAVVKIGEKGSLVMQEGKFSGIGITPARCIDTTGAGDLYASGFLYGWVNGWEPEACGKAGALLAGRVVEEAGAKINPEAWTGIRNILKIS